MTVARRNTLMQSLLGSLLLLNWVVRADKAASPVKELQRLRVEIDVATKEQKYEKAMQFTHKLFDHPSYAKLTDNDGEMAKLSKDRHKRAMLYLNHMSDPSRAVRDWSAAMESMTCQSSDESNSACDRDLKKYLFYRGRTLLKMGKCTEAINDLTDAQLIQTAISQDSYIPGLLENGAECVRIKEEYLKKKWHGSMNEDCFAIGMNELLNVVSHLIDEVSPFSSEMNRVVSRCYLERSLPQNDDPTNEQRIKKDAGVGEDKFQEASKYSSKLMKISNSNDLEALLIRGLALYHMGYNTEALKHFKQGLRSDPDNDDHRRQKKALKKLDNLMDSIRNDIRRYRYDDAMESIGIVLEMGNIPDVLAKPEPTKTSDQSEGEEEQDDREEGGEQDDDGEEEEEEEVETDVLKVFRLSTKYIQEISVLRCKAASKSTNFKNKKDKIKLCSIAVEITDAPKKDDALHVEALGLRGDQYMRMKEFDKARIDFENAVNTPADKKVNRNMRDKLNKANFEIKKAKRKDYYAILGLQMGVSYSNRDIKKAFRKCGLEHHPDTVGSDASEEEKEMHDKQFKDCVEANEILSNEEMKAKYDRGEDVLEQMQGGGGGARRGGGFPFSFFQQGGGGGGGTRFHFQFN